MGKFSVLENPEIDNLIEGYLRQIVLEVISRTTPQSIILYGSLARGEASVFENEGEIQFLSDCEIKVIGRSPHLRRLCSRLSNKMTSHFGMSISLSWMHPRQLRTNQTRYLPFGQGKSSIFMYEFKSTGKTLYGQDLLSTSPSINPADIQLDSGILLILNRMAESLEHLPCSFTTKYTHNPTRLMWLNKIVLACAEALLLSVRSYHYSYRERGRRFSEIGPEMFASLLFEMPSLIDLVARATQFKLKPDLTLYSADLSEIWTEVAFMIDIVFRYLINLEYSITFESYTEYPAKYLAKVLAKRKNGKSPIRDLVWLFSQKLIETVKQLEQRQWPPPILVSSYSSTNQVYSLVPLMFQSCFSDERVRLVKEVRQGLKSLGCLEPEALDLEDEWNSVCQQLLKNWKTFCY